MVLYENTVAAQLVHTDFKNEIARQGDTVNTRRPAKFTTKRKVDGDQVTNQDATSENVAVVLDQHHHVSFIIYDGEESKGMATLREVYLEPALKAIAQGVDEVVLGMKYSFYDQVVGKLGTSLDKAALIDTRTLLDNQLCPDEGRNFIISPDSEGDILNVSDVTTADKIGDDGTVMRTGSLGMLFGLRTHKSQNQKVITASDVQTGILTDAAHAAGATTISVDGVTGGTAPIPGEWITIAGDMTPQLILTVTGGATPTEFTIAPGLASAVADNAAVTHYIGAHVNLAAGYSAGYAKDIVYDGVTLAPRTMQGASHGVTAATLEPYGWMSTPTTTTGGLNRAVGTAMVDDANIGLFPAGDYGWAFHRNAVALISRPLAQPAGGTGVRSAVMDMGGIGIRVTIGYDMDYQGHRVTVDLLCGVKLLDKNLGCVVLA
jgi:hypothetical protein